MCDCYAPKCEKCDERIPVHIEDFNYPREDIQVFCKDHMPTERVTVWMLTGDDDFCDLKAGWTCGIRLQDGNIEPDSVGVYPNMNAAWMVRKFKDNG